MSGTELKEGMVVKLPDKEGHWVITQVDEKFPMITLGNRMSSYENKIFIKKLDADGNFNELYAEDEITTAYCFSDYIDEEDIEVVKTMKKSFL